MPTDRDNAPAIPLARWASRQLRTLALETGSDNLAALDGPTLLGERGSNGNFVIHGRISSGIGGCRLYQTRDDGWFAMTLLRPEDRELLPALFGDADVDINDYEAIARAVRCHDAPSLVSRGRVLGLPVAHADETPVSPPVEVLTFGPQRTRSPSRQPLVIDMSAIWAGPLGGHLLWLAGAQVVKVESLSRPDLIRRDDPATFDLINQGKDNIAVDFASDSQKAALMELIRRADIVLESSRPRALRHLGIDADELVREVPGLVWLTVTGHGATGEAANWTGIGNDCGVAAGLSRAMADIAGEMGFVGDALPDPLTGITAALEGWRAWRSGKACRMGFSMCAIAARALAEEREFDSRLLEDELRAWGTAVGKPFPRVKRRAMLEPAHPFGADTDLWIARDTSC